MILNSFLDILICVCIICVEDDVVTEFEYKELFIYFYVVSKYLRHPLLKILILYENFLINLLKEFSRKDIFLLFLLRILIDR